MKWSRPGLAAVLAWLLGSCNFDAALDSYCRGNPRCLADASSGPEVGRETQAEAAPASRPEAGTDTGLEVGPEAGPEAGSDVATEAGTDVGSDVFPPWDSNGPGGSPATRPPKSCGLMDACIGPNEICHPIGQVCLTRCRTAADCPPGLDTCAEIPNLFGGAPTPKVCSCSGSRACAVYSGDFRCNPADNLCERSCYNDADCGNFYPARVCNPFNFCVECVDSTYCKNRTDGRTECGPNGICLVPLSTQQ